MYVCCLLLALSAALTAPAAASGSPSPAPQPLPEGSYRLEMAVFTRAAVPVLGDVESTSRQLMVVTLAQQGEAFADQSQEAGAAAAWGAGARDIGHLTCPFVRS